jgi:hypothetical protein
MGFHRFPVEAGSTPGTVGGMTLTLAAGRRPLLLLSVLSVFAIEPGCTTRTVQTTDKAKLAADDDWVTLPPATGSNVPRRVRRSELQAEAQASGVDVISGKALLDQTRPGGPPPGAKGN